MGRHGTVLDCERMRTRGDTMGAEFSAISSRARSRVWTLHKQGLNLRQIAERIGISDRTVARIIAKKLEAQKEPEGSEGV